MATQKQKSLKIDKYNEEFIKVANDIITKDFDIFFSKVILESTKEGRTDKQIKTFIRDTPISSKNYIRESYNSTALSGITNIIEKQRLDRDDKILLVPMLIFIGIYRNNPKVIARKTELLTDRFLKNSTKGLNKVDVRAFKSLKEYYIKNKKTIKQVINRSEKQIKAIHRRIKSNVSKDIIKSLKSETKKRIVEKKLVAGEILEVKRPLTFKEVRTNLRQSFGKQTDYRVRRIVDTEMKELQEKTKEIQHLAMGYTHKKWNTQLDPKVRLAHRKLQGKIIPIDKKFRVGGKWAMYPGDPNLEAKQRINERCYLTYTKRK